MEYGFYPNADIPDDLRNRATIEMSHFGVSLILNQRLIGSGTLVRSGDRYAILTAYHVANLLARNASHLGVNIAADAHGFFIPIACIDRLIVGKPESNTAEDRGPDLALLRILDVKCIVTIKSKKSFYNLDNPALAELWTNEPPIKNMPWYLVGAPGEQVRGEGKLGTANHLLRVAHFHGEATFISIETRDNFDFIMLEMIAGDHGYPADYGGVSGGAAWLLPLKIDPDRGFSTLDYDPPVLASVPFHQSGPAKSRHLTCHGPASIYKVAADVLRR